jgi:hypothetical protein
LRVHHRNAIAIATATSKMLLPLLLLLLLLPTKAPRTKHKRTTQLQRYCRLRTKPVVAHPIQARSDPRNSISIRRRRQPNRPSTPVWERAVTRPRIVLLLRRVVVAVIEPKGSPFSCPESCPAALVRSNVGKRQSCCDTSNPGSSHNNAQAPPREGIQKRVAATLN